MKLRMALNSLAITAEDARRMKRARGSGPKTARCFRAGEMLDNLSSGFREASRRLLRAQGAPTDKCVTKPGGFARGRELTQTIDTQENEISTGFGAFTLAAANGTLMVDLKLGLDRQASAFREIADRANRAFLDLTIATETRRVTADEIREVDDLLRQSGTSAVKLIKATGGACKLNTTSVTVGIPKVRE